MYVHLGCITGLSCAFCTCACIQDLKKFNYYFWFVFPALYPDDPITYKTITTLDKAWSKEKVHRTSYILYDIVD